jgi:hypothetical protein
MSDEYEYQSSSEEAAPLYDATVLVLCGTRESLDDYKSWDWIHSMRDLLRNGDGDYPQIVRVTNASPLGQGSRLEDTVRYLTNMYRRRNSGFVHVEGDASADTLRATNQKFNIIVDEFCSDICEQPNMARELPKIINEFLTKNGFFIASILNEVYDNVTKTSGPPSKLLLDSYIGCFERYGLTLVNTFKRGKTTFYIYQKLAKTKLYKRIKGKTKMKNAKLYQAAAHTKLYQAARSKNAYKRFVKHQRTLKKIRGKGA